MHVSSWCCSPPHGPRRGEPTSDEPGDRSFHERGRRLEAAWRLNSPELFRRSLAWTNGRFEDAEEALAEVAVAALQKLPPHLDPAGARRWLLRLAYTKCMDIYRERKRARRYAMELDEVSLEAVAVAGGPSLEAAFLESELATLMRSWILDLPPRLRTVAELHLLEEMRYGEIADALAITEANVRKRMQEARDLLRDLLRAYLAGDADLRPTPGEPGTASAEGARPGSSALEDPRPRQAVLSIHALRVYIRKHPRGWKKRWELARLLRQAGELEEAVQLLRGAVERQPRRIAMALELGEILEQLGRPEEARAAYEAALRWARNEGARAALERRIETLRATARQ